MVDRIKQLCKEKKVPVSKMEQELGLGKNTVSCWDKSIPSVDKVVKVARYFSVSVDYLVGLSDIKNPAEDFSRQELDLLDFIRNDAELRAFALHLQSQHKRGSSPLPATNETKQ